MEIIKIHHPYDNKDIYSGNIVLILGFFDGVHRGHQAVIKKRRTDCSSKRDKIGGHDIQQTSGFRLPQLRSG